MNHGIKTIIYPVKDIAKAKTFYNALLGIEPTMDESYYVGYTIGDQQIGLDPNVDPNRHNHGITGPISYYHVDDIKQSLGILLSTGAQIHQEIKDVGGGKLVASVKDTDGNIIGLIQVA